jgi:hypothetical protein
MVFDISAARKPRDLYDPNIVFDGASNNRHVVTGPVLLTDQQRRIVEKYAILVNNADWRTGAQHERRRAFRDAVLTHLAAGRPGDGAVRAACITTGSDGFVTKEVREAHGGLFGIHARPDIVRRGTSPDRDDEGLA